jgi:hypothetical protein
MASLSGEHHAETSRPTETVKAYVPSDIADLVPQYLRNRKLEIQSLKDSLAVEDQDRLTQLAERMRAVGNPYGFDLITILGRDIKASVAKADYLFVKWLVEQYEEYLAAVEVVPVNAKTVARSVADEVDAMANHVCEHRIR